LADVLTADKIFINAGGRALSLTCPDRPDKDSPTVPRGRLPAAALVIVGGSYIGLNSRKSIAGLAAK
jgi:pyruvate/2-oxoglutarate dehydrogenase complex dihydrolipoamide dehydrogenase (E3) component